MVALFGHPETYHFFLAIPGHARREQPCRGPRFSYGRIFDIFVTDKLVNNCNIVVLKNF